MGFLCNRMSKKWLGMLKLFFGLALLYILYMTISYTYFISTSGITSDKDTSVSVFAREGGSRNESDSHSGSFLEAIRIISGGLPLLVQEGDGAVAHYLKFGELLPYCGLPSPCGEDQFAMHIYTGKDHNDQPRLCIDGEYIMELGLNGAGRGFNMIVIDNSTRIITRVYNFDTYQKGSFSFERTLKNLKDNSIVIIFTFDEATKKLSDRARILLQDLGSALIQNLQFRSSWYLVTQKGIHGYSPFENLHMMESGSWAEPHDVKFCVPFQIEGRSIFPDPLPHENRMRQKFCGKYPYMASFCEADVINDEFHLSPIIGDFPISSAIFSTPIIVLTDEDTTYLGMTLETIVRQPGVNPSVVVVYHLPNHPEVEALADLFNFMSEEYSSVDSYCDKLIEAQKTTKLLFPDAKQLIFIDEYVVLSPDFISFMGQLLFVLEKDSKLDAIAAWNVNGFANVSENVSTVYRSQTILRYGFMVRDNFSFDLMCRNGSTWQILTDEGELNSPESLVPEVSRVMYIPLANMSSKEGSIEEALFNHTRVTNFIDEVPLDTRHMFPDEYDAELHTLLASSISLFTNHSSAQKCIVSNIAGVDLSTVPQKGNVLAIFYEQNNATDYSVLQSLCRCFGLFYHPVSPPQGIYKGLLRFTYHGQHVLLVGSSSPFNQQWQNFGKPLVISI